MELGFPITLPLGFMEWAAPYQAAVLAGLTFIQEDAPTIGAALLSSAGSLPWSTSFVGCFLGIWIGDALLYVAARHFGRPLVERSWARRFCNSAAVARSEGWFAQRGSWLILSSRFVPGTRLPTYLAAGFLRMPFGRFLLTTGLAVLVWTTALFGLAALFGGGLFRWIRPASSNLPTILGATALLVVGVRSLLVEHGIWRWLLSFGARMAKWEFWPAWLFYAPVGAHYLWLAVRYGGITVPTAANPGQFAGGFVGESKMATLKELVETSPDFTAKSYLIQGSSPEEKVSFLEQLCRDGAVSYPFILKPNVGQRGAGVKLIRSPKQVGEYLEQVHAPVIVQQYIPGPYEVGIFYFRFPGQRRGRIFAITRKLFPTITGDGEHTIEELIYQDPRSRLIASTYLRRWQKRRAEVLPVGQTLRLVEAGNHAQGCIFEDGQDLWSQVLEERIDEISQKLTGFFIGRYDIRYSNEPGLRSGRNFQIVELNGATAEATNIYDVRTSLWSAYRTLFRQWKLVFAIGAANRQRGFEGIGLRRLFHSWRETVARMRSYPCAD
jgi:membrane protein DedA with SNARE-associated domain